MATYLDAATQQLASAEQKLTSTFSPQPGDVIDPTDGYDYTHPEATIPSVLGPVRPTQQTGSSTPGIVQRGLDALNKTFNPLQSIENGAIEYSSRLIILILGLILFTAGIFAFKQTQVVINTARKTAGKVAELTA